MKSLLEFKDVVSGYGGARVLHGMNLRVLAGESVALIGRNGVGKTTTVNTFLGIAKLMQGTLTLIGQTPRTLHHYTAARAGISLVPQGRHIIPTLTVRENLILGSAVDRKGSWNLDKVYELFPILKERADAPGTALSGGQQQMVAIGRALMANPELLVLDEPSEGLAPVIVDELAAVLRRVHAAGTGILLIEQNYSLIKRSTDRYYVMSKGAVIEQDKMDHLTMDSLKKHVAI